MHDHAPSRTPKPPKTEASQCTSKTASATHVDGQHRLKHSRRYFSVYACRVVSAYSSMALALQVDYMPTCNLHSFQVTRPAKTAGNLRPTQVVPVNQIRARDRLLYYSAAMFNTHVLVGSCKLQSCRCLPNYSSDQKSRLVLHQTSLDVKWCPWNLSRRRGWSSLT
jgi:hypothetical protein